MFSLTDYDVRPLDFSKFKKKFAFEICHEEMRTYYMYAETQEEQESWQSFLLCATVKLQWGGIGVAQFSGRGRRGRASVGEAKQGPCWHKAWKACHGRARPLRGCAVRCSAGR